MTTPACVICGQAAEVGIPDGRVCRAHAIEFYAGLLAYAHDQPRVVERARVPRPYVKVHPKWIKVRRETVAA